MSVAPDTNAYSRDIKALKNLAPAIPQKSALLLILLVTTMGMEATFRNTLAFFRSKAPKRLEVVMM
jgi:hypothetical protein